MTVLERIFVISRDESEDDRGTGPTLVTNLQSTVRATC
jgi:hypothetical protein